MLSESPSISTMTNSDRIKGERRERELVRKLWDAGVAVIRVPTSGAATDRELPDVLMASHGRLGAFEVKATGDERLYIEGYEIEDLLKFARRAGAYPFIAYYYDYHGFRFCHPSHMHETPQGNFRIHWENCPWTFKDVYSRTLSGTDA